MVKNMEIKLVVDASLLDHFKQGLQKKRSENIPENEIANLVAFILSDSDFPIAAQKIGDLEIQLSYHVRSFSQPFFD